MLRFSKKVEYALIVLVEMDHGGEHAELVTAKSLAEQFHIPSEILGKVLQTMVKTGLLFSVQGVKGGYTLARSLSDISVLQLINAIDGEIALTACLHEDTANCAQYDYCTIRTPMEVVQTELEHFFNRISVQDIKNKYNGNAQAL
jgi:Rrf2 family protein